MRRSGGYRNGHRSVMTDRSASLGTSSRFTRLSIFGTRTALWTSIVSVYLFIVPSLAAAQRLPIKRALAASGVSGCASFPPVAGSATTSPNADAESRRLIDDAQDAALSGDHAAARDAFGRAARLAPGNSRVAYYLGREHEALSESNAAVREYTATSR